MTLHRRTGGRDGENKATLLRRGPGRRGRVCRRVLGVLLVIAAPLVGPTPAYAGVGVGVSPDFPTGTTVGDAFIGGLDIFNNSTPPESVLPLTITSITLAPGCSVVGVPNCAGGVDAGVFTLGTVGTGSADCAGITFTITQTSPGLYSFTPSGPLLLDAGERCRIDFPVTTSRVPTVDLRPDLPGRQTNVLATVGATSPFVPGETFIGTGGDQVTILAFPATIATVAAPPQVDINEQFSDTAVVTGVPGGPVPTGTVTFQLYGPAAPGFPDCTTPPVFTSAPIPLTATNPTTATANSGPVSTATPGNYVFVATFTPTPGSSFLATTSPCNDPNERVTVQALPTITVDKTATPLSLPEPGGNFTFNVLVTNTSPEPVTITSLTDNIYGNIATQGSCTTAIGTRLGAAPGPGNTYSCSFTGSFNGLAPASQTDIVTAVAVDDQGNTATDSDDAIVTLTPSPPTIVVVKTANPLSLPEPGGTFTFTVVVTNTSPRAVTITSLTDNIYGNIATQGSCVTAIGTVLVADPPGAAPGGSYTCSFTGPFNGNAGASQTDIVTAVAVDTLGQTATDSDDAIVTLTNVPPTILVDKTATPLTLPEPGGNFTFNVVVTNTSFEPVTITTLTDNIYGNIATQGTCTTAMGTVLAASPGPGNTYSCSFTGPFAGPGGASQTDIVTAVAVDNDGTTATDTDDAIVRITDVAPTVLVDKTATPGSRPEPGGPFTYNVVVTNTSSEPVTITTLTDSVYGNLATRGTCTTAIGTVLPASGGTYSCSFTAPFNGNAGASLTDVVTVVVVDDEGTTATDDDDAVVTITNVPPTIQVDKTATPVTRLEPGGAFTFNVVVTNTSIEPVTITSLTDNIYGNIATQGTCTTAIGTVLPANGGTYSCSFTGNFFGAAGAEQTDIVTAVAVDDDGSSATDSDDAIVAITNVVPTILVDKTATPGSLPEPGGTFTFNVVVTNTSIEPVTITSLTDNIYGNIATQGTCTTAIGRVLAANGGTYSCSFTGPFNGEAGASQTDIVTAVAVDDDGTVVNDTDDAVVTITDVLPTINVVKTAAPLSRPEPGGTFTFSVVVTNTSAENLTITTLTDNIYGNLATQGTCTTAVGRVLAPGATFSCAFPGNFTGNAGATQTDIVTVTGVDNEGNTATDTDDAVVVLTDVAPTVQVVKTATPLTRPEPGGAFTFNVVVTNTSAEPVAITTLTDNIYGNIATQGTCTTAIGTVLAPAATYSCSFTGNFAGNAGASQTDIVTVVVTDNDGTTATDDDDAVVNLTNVPPTVQVDKTATPLTRPEPGGAFTFNVVVTNTSFEPVTITTLTDNIYGNIATQGTCTTAIGTVLAPAATYSCSFTGNFTGGGGDAQTDIVTVVVTDNDNTTATDTDDAVVTLTDILPTLQVVKTATPLTLPEPGGNFTFNVVVTNPGPEPLTITALTDNIYGNIATQGTCTTAIGTTLTASPGPGNTYSCSFTGAFAGNAGDQQVDIVTGTAEDDEGNPATDTDDATVAITNVVPTVLVDKTATPETLPAPGGPFTFNVVVTNISSEPLTITALTDDIYGNIATQGTCTTAIGTVLAPGKTYTCSFTGNFTGASGSQRDVVTVIATDDDGTTATDTDDATVTITPAQVLPEVVTNNPNPPSPPARVIGNLARTGSSVSNLVALAVGLVAAGGLLLLGGGARWAPRVPVVDDSILGHRSRKGRRRRS